jgi:hypothetical protein
LESSLLPAGTATDTSAVPSPSEELI